LHDALAKLAASAEMRRALGENGARWVREKFDRKIVWNNLVRVYQEMLAGDTH